MFVVVAISGPKEASSKGLASPAMGAGSGTRAGTRVRSSLLCAAMSRARSPTLTTHGFAKGVEETSGSGSHGGIRWAQ